MSNKNYFPLIVVKESASGFQATAAIKLQSILKGTLMEGRRHISPDGKDDVERIDPCELHSSRLSFINALSRWPENVVMELCITSLPNLAYRSRGRLSLAILTHAWANSEETAKETVIARYLSLMPLLMTYFPEGEFCPVTAPSEFADLEVPVKPLHALAVQRRLESISLSNPLPRHTVGLMTTAAAENQGRWIRHCFPWTPSFDDWSRLLDMLIHQLESMKVTIRLQKTQLGEIQRHDMENTIRQCEKFLTSGESYQLILKRQVEMLRDVTLEQRLALELAAFKVGVFITAPCPIDHALGGVVGQSITGHGPAGRKKNDYCGGFDLVDIPVSAAGQPEWFPEKAAFCANEAAAAFRLPSPPLEDRPGITLRRSRTGFAMMPWRMTEEKSSIAMFRNRHQQMEELISIGAHDRMRHTFIIGQTGTGKSTLMESMILQDIRNGQGLAVIDPHGDMIDSLLGKVPPERAEDIIVFDVLDRECPLGFNILEWKTIDERDLIIDEIYTTMDHIYDIDGWPDFRDQSAGDAQITHG